jgi:Kef-type K+ transport system membrane component KefB
MPSLVGEIFVGILLGPNLAAYVPNPVSFVMLGEIGLILLVLEAGIDIDLTMLKLIGTRGFIIAIIGSILPIAIAIAIAFAIGTDTAGSIAAGAAFGPTSLGIAMNILRQVGAFLSQFKWLLHWLMYISLLSGENCQHSRRAAYC